MLNPFFCTSSTCKGTLAKVQTVAAYDDGNDDGLATTDGWNDDGDMNAAI